MQNKFMVFEAFIVGGLLILVTLYNLLMKKIIFQIYVFKYDHLIVVIFSYRLVPFINLVILNDSFYCNILDTIVYVKENKYYGAKGTMNVWQQTIKQLYEFNLSRIWRNEWVVYQMFIRVSAFQDQLSYWMNMAMTKNLTR